MFHDATPGTLPRCFLPRDVGPADKNRRVLGRHPPIESRCGDNRVQTRQQPEQHFDYPKPAAPTREFPYPSLLFVNGKLVAVHDDGTHKKPGLTVAGELRRLGKCPLSKRDARHDELSD